MENVHPVSRMMSTMPSLGLRESIVATKSGSKSDRDSWEFKAIGRKVVETRRNGATKNGDDGVLTFGRSGREFMRRKFGSGVMLRS